MALPMKSISCLAMTLLIGTNLFAVDYANELSARTYTVAGTFGQYDFPEAQQAFDWAFTSPDGAVYQLQGIPPTDESVFGWKSVNIPSPVPAWYMLYLESDVDGDGTTKFDWVLVDTAGQAVYKLAGVTAAGTFAYSDPIAITATLAGDKKQIVFADLSNSSASSSSSASGNGELNFDTAGTYDLSHYFFPPSSRSMSYNYAEYSNYSGTMSFGAPESSGETTYYFNVSGSTVFETSSDGDTDETNTILSDRIENLDNDTAQTITSIRYADKGELIAKQEHVDLGEGVYIDGLCSLSNHLSTKSVEGQSYSDVIEITCHYSPSTAGATGASTATTYLAKDIGQIYWIHTGCVSYMGYNICFKSEESFTGSNDTAQSSSATSSSSSSSVSSAASSSISNVGSVGDAVTTLNASDVRGWKISSSVKTGFVTTTATVQFECDGTATGMLNVGSLSSEESIYSAYYVTDAAGAKTLILEKYDGGGTVSLNTNEQIVQNVSMIDLVFPIQSITRTKACN